MACELARFGEENAGQTLGRDRGPVAFDTASEGYSQRYQRRREMRRRMPPLSGRARIRADLAAPDPRWDDLKGLRWEIAMAYYVRMPVEGSAEAVLIEVSANGEGDELVRAAQPGAVIDRVGESVQAAVAKLRPAVAAVTEQLTKMPTRPDHITVEFGIKFTAELGAVIANAGSEASFGITMTWDKGELDDQDHKALPDRPPAGGSSAQPG
ncbi:CU044_2847 family protein [Nonomuraea sp. NPDC003707]